MIRETSPLDKLGSVRLALLVALLSACTSVAPPIDAGQSAESSAVPSARGEPSGSTFADTERTVIDEALAGKPLSIALDGRVVRLTRDDFLSGHREEAGRDIVGGGLNPKTTFWFIVDPSVPGRAVAAWVEQRRGGFPEEGIYQQPTEPLRDLVEIVDPSLAAAEASRLHTTLGIGGGELPPPRTDVSVEVGGIRYHLIADRAAVFLVATGTAD